MRLGRQATAILPRDRRRFGAGDRRRQGLQQRFAIVAGIAIGIDARRLVPFRTTVAAVALPIAAVAITFTLPFLRPIILRAFGTRAILLLGPLIALTIITLAFLRAVVALAVVPLPFVSLPFVALALLRAVITLPVVPLPVVALAIPPLRAIIAHAFGVAFAIAARIILAGSAIIDIVAAIVTGFAVVIGIHAVIIITIAATAGIGLAITVIAEQPEIMFRVLQIIFGGHPVAGLLGVARQGAIFFQQLGGIAALAVVEPRAIVVATSHLLRARAIVAATPTPPLVVSDQEPCPRSWPVCGRYG